jgi:predicted exporter
MKIFSQFNFETLAKHKKIYFVFLCFVFLCALFAFFRINFVYDFSQMLPSSLEKQLKLFQSSPLSKKVFIAVISKDPAIDISQTAQETQDFFLENEDLGLSSPEMDISTLLSFYHYFPNLWDENDAQKMKSILSPTEINKRLSAAIKSLYSPSVFMMQDLLLADPLNLLPIFSQKLKNLDFSGSLDPSAQGFLSPKDKNAALLLFDYRKNFLDIKKAQVLDAAFEALKKEYEGFDIFYIGAPRFTALNNEVIRADISRILIISFLLMLALFLVFLRDKNALFVYIVPFAIVIIASAIVSLGGRISAVTLGFGSVLAGLSADYSLYMYFALKSAAPQDHFNAARKMFKPILASAATSIAVFLLLIFSGIEVFKQTAVFCAVGLTMASFIALCAAPFIFSGQKKEFKEISNSSENFLSKKAAVILVLIIIAAAALSLNFIRIDSSLESMNISSKSLKADRQKFDELTGSSFSDNKSVFVFGNSKEEALRNNEALSAKNPDYFKLSAIFPSQKKAAENKKQWIIFWKNYLPLIRNSLTILSKDKIAPNAFNDFYAFLESAQAPNAQEFDLTVFFNPLIEIDGKFAFINIAPHSAQINEIENIETQIISNASLSDEIMADASSRLIKIMLALFICSFAVLFLIFRSFRLAFLAVLPSIMGLCGFLIIAAAFRIDINLMGLYGMPLLIGLGADYGVFMVYQKRIGKSLHPTKALITAALSTLIGFGSLMAARHPVLFAMGFMIFTGISFAALSSIFILAPLLEKESSMIGKIGDSD